MANIKSFQDILVWQKAHELVLLIYHITTKFPSDEKYGLVSQIRRAVISVPANIVEGFRRAGIKDSLRFYDIANASLEELRYEIRVSFDLGYISKIEYQEACVKMEEVSKMLNSWIKSQRNKSAY